MANIRTARRTSLAGTQELGNLIVFYDHNQISIEHDTNIALSEDVPDRYRAYGWHVQEVEGGENVVGIEQAIAEAKEVTDKPSFISVRTIIGYPAPTKMNTGGVNGSAHSPKVPAARCSWNTIFQLSKRSATMSPSSLK